MLSKIKNLSVPVFNTLKVSQVPATFSLSKVLAYNLSYSPKYSDLYHHEKVPKFLKPSDTLSERHTAPNESEIQAMLKEVNASSLDELIRSVVPAKILDASPYQIKSGHIPNPESESLFLQKFKSIASKTKLNKCYIGGGYYGSLTPEVILRNVLDNPNWYTAYTPYQAEISQGRLEALLNYQTLCVELTGLEVSNASLLDEGTACAEAMMLCSAANPKRTTFFASNSLFPNSLEIIKTRAENYGLKVIIDDPNTFDFESVKDDLFGIIVQTPDAGGSVHNYTNLFGKIKGIAGDSVKIAVACDPFALLVTATPGEMGADVAVGCMQRFGVPLGNGGPHAAFMVTKGDLMRKMPGRIIGVSKDKFGNSAFRMTLQTREQHIKREKATSNICTAQALLANMAGFYAVYHRKDGLLNIAQRINGLTQVLAINLVGLGYKISQNTEKINFFDTITIEGEDSKLLDHFYQNSINLGQTAKGLRISIDETTTVDDLCTLISLFAEYKGKSVDVNNIINNMSSQIKSFDKNLQRTKQNFLQQEIFNSVYSEHQMLRYLQMLVQKDITLSKSMIALGSCTMKLNASTEMRTIGVPEISSIHPFTPKEQLEGYSELLNSFKRMLCAVTKFDDVSLQPNSGAQGEYAGLSTIKKYLESRGEGHRKVCLIPASAHGTNPASAVLCGMKVVIVKSDEKGNVDLADLKTKAEQHKKDLAAFMITYPSTHGVYEDTVIDAINIIHENGGQVYMDGANMNAQVGLTSPGYLGADVCHLNLHKTFCIPHGGGGPGMGPIGVKAHLAPFLPGRGSGAVCSAEYGSASILPISMAYIWCLGMDGLTHATKVSILNANYMQSRLKAHYKILYSGQNGRCAHEFLVDFRPIKAVTGISEEDVAKRLADYGFHAPTMSFPVVGAMLIEPTESEDKAELDRFIDAMINIRKEIQKVEEGVWDKADNPLKNAPHPAEEVTGSEWKHCYSREEAAYPLEWVKSRGKYWPSVGRIDNVYGDRNPMCTCPSPVEYL